MIHVHILTVVLALLLVLTAAFHKDECNPPCGEGKMCLNTCHGPGSDCKYYCACKWCGNGYPDREDISKCGSCPGDQYCFDSCLTCHNYCGYPMDLESLSSSNTISSSGIIASYAGAVFIAMTIMIVQM